MSESRKLKHWGACGSINAMYGKTGPLNPNWKGGGSPERQRIYASHEWRKLKQEILARDGYHCQKCGALSHLEIHHISSWARFPELRLDPDNLITFCEDCHKEIRDCTD